MDDLRVDYEYQDQTVVYRLGFEIYMKKVYDTILQQLYRDHVDHKITESLFNRWLLERGAHYAVLRETSAMLAERFAVYRETYGEHYAVPHEILRESKCSESERFETALMNYSIVETKDDAKNIIVTITETIENAMRLFTESKYVVILDGHILTVGKCTYYLSRNEVFMATSVPRLDTFALLKIRYSRVNIIWSLSASYYKVLYNEFGVRNMAYASPFNAYAFGNYYSLFSDTDMAFGSIGNLHGQNANLGIIPGNWHIMPPFIDSLISQSIDDVFIMLRDSGKDKMIFMVLPLYWFLNSNNRNSNMNYYILVDDNCLHEPVVFKKGEYLVETSDGNLAPLPFDVVHFILKRGPLDQDVVTKYHRLLYALRARRVGYAPALQRPPAVAI